MQGQIGRILRIIPKGKERNPELTLEQLRDSIKFKESNNPHFFEQKSFNYFFFLIINHLGFQQS